MSAGSLFDSESDKSSNIKIYMIAAAAFAVLAGFGYGFYWYTSPVPRGVEEIHAEEIRDSTVIMLSQPGFTGEDFTRQILGKGHIVKYTWDFHDAYFTFPQTDEQEFDDFITKYFYDRTKLEFGEEGGGRMRLGVYSMPVLPDTKRFFRTKIDNVRIDPKQELTFPLNMATYTLSLDELRNLSNNSELYGGMLVARVPERKDEPQFVFANHGIMVAKPNEPSLKRLTEQLLKDVGPDREARIQRLVDFASNEIEYSYTEAVGSRETLKRASETIMTRSGDCSNKTILLASLLEQINEEYILLYCPRHITVAIPQGNYPNENKLDFEWNQKPWLIAETTMPGFQIGISRVSNPEILTHVNYVQNPKNSNVIIDASSYQVLKFY